MDHQRRKKAVTVLAAGVVAAACSSSSASPAPAASTDPQFRRDVVPIFQRWCATSGGCHGPADDNTHYDLGDPAGLHAVLLGDSRTAPGVKIVAPGDPFSSFLYAKINGDEGNFESQCKDMKCGDSMPPGTKIKLDEREAIKTWIAQGAKDD
jgi:hypothetical protein